MRSIRFFVLCVLTVAALAGCGGPSVELTGGVFGVAFVSPSHGAVNVGEDVAIEVGFSTAVDADSLEGLALLREVGDSEISVEFDQQISSDFLSVVLIPVDFLEADTRYTVVIPGSVASAEGISLNTELRSEFQTAATP